MQSIFSPDEPIIFVIIQGFLGFFLDHLNRRPRAIFYDCLMSMVAHLLVFRVLLVFIMEAAVLIRS